MADAKISELTAATTLAANDAFPVVQGAANRKVLANTILTSRVVSVVTDGATDNSAAIIAAITEAKAAGGRVLFFPGGVIAHTQPIVLEDASGVVIEGAGSRRTEFKYTGAAAEAGVTIQSSQTAAAKMTSAGLRSLRLNGNGLVNKTLFVRSIDACEFADIELRGGVQWQWDWACHEARIRPAEAVSGGDPADNQNNETRRLKMVCTGTQGGARLGGNSSAVVNVGANTSLNYFENVFCDIRDGDGFVFGYSDANTMVHFRCFRPDVNTGRGLVFAAGAAGNLLHSRHNVCFHVQASRAGVHALAGDGTQPSESNSIIGYSLGNQGVNYPPVVEAGASLTYISPEGSFQMGSHGAIAVGHASQVTAAARIEEQRTLLTTESMRVWNVNNNHLVLTNGTPSVPAVDWKVYIDQTNGDLILFRAVGASGRVHIASGATRVNTIQIGTPPVQVLAGRRVGWAEPIGSVDRTAFDVATVTTTQLAQRVNGLIRDLIAHGLIGE